MFPVQENWGYGTNGGAEELMENGKSQTLRHTVMG